jgi:methylase of polypeptide subunit release factors
MMIKQGKYKTIDDYRMYWYGVFEITENGVKRIKTVVDSNGHPFISLKIYQDFFGKDNVILLFWKEISQEEYNFYIDDEK